MEMPMTFPWLEIAFTLADPGDFDLFGAAARREGMEHRFEEEDYRRRVAAVRERMKRDGCGHQEAYLAILEEATPPQAPPQAAPGKVALALETAADVVKSGFARSGEEELDRRMAICRGCEEFTGMRCRLCGCFMRFKARLLAAHCPAGRW